MRGPLILAWGLLAAHPAVGQVPGVEDICAVLAIGDASAETMRLQVVVQDDEHDEVTQPQDEWLPLRGLPVATARRTADTLEVFVTIPGATAPLYIRGVRQPGLRRTRDGRTGHDYAGSAGFREYPDRFRSALLRPVACGQQTSAGVRSIPSRTKLRFQSPHRLRVADYRDGVPLFENGIPLRDDDLGSAADHHDEGRGRKFELAHGAPDPGFGAPSRLGEQRQEALLLDEGRSKTRGVRGRVPAIEESLLFGQGRQMPQQSEVVSVILRGAQHEEDRSEGREAWDILDPGTVVG